jgi:UPF0755 protein
MKRKNIPVSVLFLWFLNNFFPMKFKLKLLTAVFLVLLVALGGFFYFRHLVYFWRGGENLETVFVIEKGQGVSEVSENLKEKGLIKSVWAFYYYLEKSEMSGKILPGEYELDGKMAIPELATVITSKKEEFVKVTFPEGFNVEKMAERLSANGLPGAEFLGLTKNPDDFRDDYAFLTDRKIKTLEGFLFPDTYFFKPDDTGEKIVRRMLSNFSNKYSGEISQKISNSGKSLLENIIMASIIEGEVRSAEDRKMVSGLFWRRIEEGKPLQSCASIAYVLGVNKKQYSFEDTRISSPYNTYLNTGLPPGPINNPGLDSILAASDPAKSDYLFFLSDPETGKTVYSKTIEEHNANKVRYGL